MSDCEKWFAVKTVYKTTASGKPKIIDKNYRDDLALIEERIVLIRAKEFDDAIAKAEQDANNYAGDESYVNAYGQKVNMKYLSCCDAYELYDESIENFSEVFSSTRLVNKSLTKNEVADLIFGQKETKISKSYRKKFLNSSL